MALRAPRPPSPPATPPLDLRVMNAAASLLFAVAAIALLGLLLGWVTRSPRFTLERIHIEGDFEHGNLASVRANALPKLQGNFFSLDLARAQAAFQSVPWVRRAMVQRLWPNRLAVRLEEHRVAAWWQVDEGDDKLVNVQGEVFEANTGDVEDEDLPVLAGPAGSSAAVLAMHRRLAPVFGAIGAQCARLTMSARGSWRAVLDSGAAVELGRGSDDEVLARTQAFVATLPQLTERYQRPLAHADLRHADGYALRLVGIGTVAPGAPGTKPKK